MNRTLFSSKVDEKHSKTICKLGVIFLAVLGSMAFLFSVFAENGRTEGLTLKQKLGKLLFFDPNLSFPNGMSCATCHDPNMAFTDPRSSFPVSGGVIYGRFGNRNAPSAAYAAYSPVLYFDPTPNMGNMMQGMYRGGQFWDGRASTLEDQAKQPILNPLEMNNLNKRQVITQIRQGEYADLFEKVFGPRSLNHADTAYDNVVEAIAEYERSSELSPFSSKYDQYLANPTHNPLTVSEARGLALFTGKANCKNCHVVDSNNSAGRPLFTSFGYQNIGVPRNPDNPFYSLRRKFNPDGENFIDLGLGGILNNSKHYGQFKIPSLRNVAVTAPYMHNGAFKTLREVLDFDNTRDLGGYPPAEVGMNVHRHMPPMDGFFGRLGLTPQEIEDIISFLLTLTDGYAM
jgi:cytochrome c peroxidase